jgi:hypothetical protein
MQIRDGMLSKNLRQAFKWMSMVASYESGKPVETHRMVALNEGPGGAYDLSKLSANERKALLVMLKKAQDKTDASNGEDNDKDPSE